MDNEKRMYNKLKDIKILENILNKYVNKGEKNNNSNNIILFYGLIIVFMIFLTFIIYIIQNNKCYNNCFKKCYNNTPFYKTSIEGFNPLKYNLLENDKFKNDKFLHYIDYF